MGGDALGGQRRQQDAVAEVAGREQETVDRARADQRQVVRGARAQAGDRPDQLHLGDVGQQAVGLAQQLEHAAGADRGVEAALFDGGADDEAVGSANNEVSTCVAWHSAPVKSFGQLLNTTLVIGGDGPGADGEQFARVMNALFDTRIKIVSGYPGGNAINLAVERGEVEGRCGWSWSGIVAERRHWLDERKINVLVQFGLQKHADLPDVPMVLDFAKSDEQRQILQLVLARQPLGRPYLAPPGMPADRAEALRAAFMATMNDPQFQAAAQRSKLEINPMSGAEVAGLINGIVTGVSSSAVARTKEILSRN